MPKKLSNALASTVVKDQRKNPEPGRHADGNGLHLLVKETGAMSWVFRFMLHGKSRDIGMGPVTGSGALTLADARLAASALRLKVKAGIDPLAERQQKAAEVLAAAQMATIAGMTFKTVAEAHIASNEARWRNDKHKQQWRNTLSTYVYPVMGDLPVATIGTAHVLSILEPIWQAKPETASRIRGRIEVVLDAAKVRGYREGENPARWRGHLAHVLPARARLTRGHHTAMPYADVAAFIARLRQREAAAALALEFAILTATRTNEVLGATWSEVDTDKAMWTIPATRMKAGREHRVPLSPRAIEILDAMKPLGKTTLFSGNRGGKLSGMAMAMLLRRMDVAVTVHGFRSAFRDWAGECTGYPREVCEMALAHKVADKTEEAYARSDLVEKRRRLMADWSTYCAQAGSASATVTPIKSAA